MSLSNEVIESITQLAVSLGYTSGASGQAAAYEQIYLAKFIHENWGEFAGKFDGLIDLDYNFLGMDLSQVGSSLFSQFPSGGWPVIGILILPLISAALQFLMTKISMKSNGSANANGASKAMIYMMPLMTVWMGYILPAALCVYWIANAAFSCLQELFPEQALQQAAGSGGDGQGASEARGPLRQDADRPRELQQPAGQRQGRQEAPAPAQEEKIRRAAQRLHHGGRPRGRQALCPRTGVSGGHYNDNDE